MLIIRLQRVGRKNQPVFRIVLAEKQRSAKKQFVELLGHYNPRSKEFGLKDPERVKYWIQKHVQISPTMNNLLIDKGLLSGEKIKAWKPKAKKAEAKVPEAAGVKSSTEAKPEAKAETAAEDKAETKPSETVATVDEKK